MTELDLRRFGVFLMMGPPLGGLVLLLVLDAAWAIRGYSDHLQRDLPVLFSGSGVGTCYLVGGPPAALTGAAIIGLAGYISSRRARLAMSATIGAVVSGALGAAVTWLTPMSDVEVTLVTAIQSTLSFVAAGAVAALACATLVFRDPGPAA